MNGRWAFLFRAVLITTPAAWALFVTVDLPWRIWVTKNTFETRQHETKAEECMRKIDRFMTTHQADYQDLERRVDNLPPQEWRDRIHALEEYERQNKDDHTKILVSLESIKAMLGQHLDDNRPNGARLPIRGAPNHETTSTAYVRDRDSDLPDG